MNTISKSSWCDNLRVIATIGVIGIHVSSPYQPSKGVISDYDFWVGNFFDSLSRFSVPVFVMLSGALLLGKEYPLGTFFKKRLARLLYPFSFWSSIYTLKSLWELYDEGGALTFSKVGLSFLEQFRDGSSIHLWYIYMIVGLYLFIPIIGKWVRHSSGKEQLYFLGIWTLTVILNQPILDVLKPAVELSYFSGFLGYLVLGYYLGQRTFSSRKQQNVIGISLTLVGLASTVLGTFLIQYNTGKYENTFYECLSPNILLYSAGLFVLLKDTHLEFPPLVKVRDFICRYSYGIYLVHVLVFFQLEDYGMDWRFLDPVIGIPLTTLLTLVISAAIVFIIHKLPFGKYIAG